MLHVDAALQAVADKLGIAVETVVQKVTLDLHAKITKRTPVATGRARASWNVAQGEPLTDVPPEPAGEEILPAPGTPTFVVSGYAPVYITSSLPYMEALENGHSQQAPAGMVAVSIAEIEAELEHILKSTLT